MLDSLCYLRVGDFTNPVLVGVSLDDDLVDVLDDLHAHNGPLGFRQYRLVCYTGISCCLSVSNIVLCGEQGSTLTSAVVLCNAALLL